MTRPVWVMPQIEIPASQMLSLNDRRDRRRTSGTVRSLRSQASVSARAAGAPALDRARLVAWLRFPDGRRRDPHNYMPTLKALVDGLVDAGLVPDDDRRYLQGPDPRWDPEPTRPRLGEPMFAVAFEAYPFEGRGGSFQFLTPTDEKGLSA